MRRIISDIINSDEELHNERFAVNGLEGIALLESGFRFDCIILDINMPKMNGIEFLRTMNRKGIKQNVIIVSTIAKGPEFSKRLIRMLYEVCKIPIQNKMAKAAREVKKELSRTAPKKQPVLKSDRTLHSTGTLGVGKSKLVALACSTGGPKSLQQVIQN